MGISERFMSLPVQAVLAELRIAFETSRNAVLAAPPGAGKTTLVPLDLLEAHWCTGRIILIEPRRLAARAAARRMAAMIGEEVGGTVGYRMRLDNRISGKTRIEVVTEGVFTRMALDDPELSGISLVIFDEFHERALEADFGLALALDVQVGLREDLRILVMSATLDVERVARLMETDAVIESQGRAFPVDIRYESRPGDVRIEDAMANAIRQMHRQEKGSILAFLPGQGEILRVVERLEGNFDEDTAIMPLYGALTGAEQDRAIRPQETGKRKIVLATPVAESSITIDGVRIVIDSGLVRQPVLDPETGITRLETMRASRASADQRAGRAGRTEPGIALRLWHSGQTAALPTFASPQILAADLSGLLLDCVAWGVTDPSSLRFIDPPPQAAVTEARKLLMSLGALDQAGRLTSQGEHMRALPLPPRLAAMVAHAKAEGDAITAARIAVLLTEQGLGGNSIDLDDRLTRFVRDSSPRAKAADGLARRIAGNGSKDERLPAAAHLASAFPDRIAKQRGGRGRFVMANGRGCEVEDTDRLAGAGYLVIADLTGRAAKSRVLAAAELSGALLEPILDERAETREECRFDPESGSVRARQVRRLGAIILEEKPLKRPPPDVARAALCQGVRDHGIGGLNFSKAAMHLRERVDFLRRSLGGEDWPDMSDQGLAADPESWLAPFLGDAISIREIGADRLSEALRARLDYSHLSELDRLAPTHYRAPTGSDIPIRYDGDEPVLAIRVQELFGESRHPSIAGGKVPLLLELLSPAHRPIQTTRDLSGFWRGSWKDVRADMRGRYPKHEWPENPEAAAPTRRAKPRGG